MPIISSRSYLFRKIDPTQITLSRSDLFKRGRKVGVSWSAFDDGSDSAFASSDENGITTQEIHFSNAEFQTFCGILTAWSESAQRMGGWVHQAAPPVPNRSHSRYFAPGADEPMDYPLDRFDQHYQVPRRQFETMTPEPCNCARCPFLTAGQRWPNVLGHVIGESYHWGKDTVAWDRFGLVLVLKTELTVDQFNQLWNYHMTVRNVVPRYAKEPINARFDLDDAKNLLAINLVR